MSLTSSNTLKSKPDFIIVGAAKSGTTSLASYLNMHPDIFSPHNKEPRFFIKETLFNISDKDPMKKYILQSSVLDEKDYFNLYKRDSHDNRITYDASVHYLYHYKEAIPKIKNYIGDVPIIIMLRKPSSRAISGINYLSKWHNNSIVRELFLEQERIDGNFNSIWYYKNLGLYSHQVKAYSDHFSRVKVVLFDRFVTNTISEFNDILDFLSLSNFDLENVESFNSSFEPSFYLRILRKFGFIEFIKNNIPLNVWDNLKYSTNSFLVKNKSDVSDELKEDLSMYFNDDISQLESIIKKDLSSWKIF